MKLIIVEDCNREYRRIEAKEENNRNAERNRRRRVEESYIHVSNKFYLSTFNRIIKQGPDQVGTCYTSLWFPHQVGKLSRVIISNKCK